MKSTTTTVNTIGLVGVFRFHRERQRIFGVGIIDRGFVASAVQFVGLFSDLVCGVGGCLWVLLICKIDDCDCKIGGFQEIFFQSEIGEKNEYRKRKILFYAVEKFYWQAIMKNCIFPK